MKLLLTSNGLSGVTEFLADIANPKIAIITDAATRPADIDSINFDLKELRRFGLKQFTFVSLEHTPPQKFQAILDSHDAVFGEGGSQEQLMYALRVHGADKQLIAYLHKGGRYIGKSAGSIVAGTTVDYPRNISPIWDEDSDAVPQPKSNVGLGLVPVRVIPHCPSAERLEAFKQLRARGEFPLPLPDNRALLVNDSGFAVVNSSISNLSSKSIEGVNS